MYLRSFAIEDVKCFSRAPFEFPARSDGRRAGWHVLLGANATGKTTLLRAIAVSLMGPGAWSAFEPIRWVRQGARKRGALRAVIEKGSDDVADRAQKGPFTAEIDVVADAGDDDEMIEGPRFVLRDPTKALQRSVYASRKPGWFSCGYGPYRRLSGGSADALVGLNHARQIRVASLFREAIALTECEQWLKDLHHRAGDETNPDRSRDDLTLTTARDAINSMLPAAVQLAQVSSAGARFTTAGATQIALSDLSDGFRSFLAFAIDILRHFTDASDGDLLKHVVPGVTVAEDGRKRDITALGFEGVVLIDEVDTHLHPSWQRRIGPMLQRVFPNVQFIVSTHSPFVAQSASEGGLFVLQATPDRGVRVVQPAVSVRGWRADALLTSELFGLSDTVDLATEARLAEYHALASKRAFEALDGAEQTRLDALETELSRTLVSPGETVVDFERRKRADAFVDEVVRGLETPKSA